MVQVGDIVTDIGTGKKWTVEWTGVSSSSGRFLVRAGRYKRRKVVYGSFLFYRGKDYRLFYEGEYTY